MRVRRAVAMAIDQRDYLAIMGGAADAATACAAMLPCDTPMSTNARSVPAMGNDPERARHMLQASSYDGRTVVILSPSDQPFLANFAAVTANMLQMIGMMVEVATADWATIVKRRTSRSPPGQGGWNIFHAMGSSVEFLEPATHLALRANGADAWLGWPDDPDLERLRRAWLEAPARPSGCPSPTRSIGRHSSRCR